VFAKAIFGDVLEIEDKWDIIKSRARIAWAENDILVDENGCRLIDLFAGNGTVWLGHAHSRICARVSSQVGKLWSTGGLETQIHLDAVAAVERFLPPSHYLTGFYSTGMEAAEFAMRFARVVTGKPGVVGFERSMHGKSMATAYLGWDNRDGLSLPQLHRIPFVSVLPEEEVLDRLAAVLRAHPISAVFIEPVQGSGGGHSGSDTFYREVYRLCREAGTLLVFDEILTGFYRTGPPFCFSNLGFTPDLVLLGKAMGNGFPVSGVAARKEFTVVKEMLPGSTYAGNPLACAAVAATLEELPKARPADRVARIERIIRESVAPLAESSLQPRGRGAMWIIEMPQGIDVERIALDLYRCGVFVSYAGRLLRFLPALTILPERLAQACDLVFERLAVHAR
jgi:acetylornithine/succinyldiaminopimelate/putrescine aminotransferase